MKRNLGCCLEASVWAAAMLYAEGSALAQDRVLLPSTRQVDQAGGAPVEGIAGSLSAAIEASGVRILLPALALSAPASESGLQRIDADEDGYSALISTDQVDIVTYGTKTVYGEDQPERRQADYTNPFEEWGEGIGGHISYGRYGADYITEFYCKNGRNSTPPGTLAEVTEPDRNCVTASEAEEFVETLQPAS